MDWIDLAQGSGHWRALVNVEMNLRGLYIMLGSSCMAAQVAASRGVSCSIQLIS
jgi:hypothetical protein